MVCEKCQERLMKKYDEKLDKLTPAQRQGFQGKRLASPYEMLINAKCNCTDA